MNRPERKYVLTKVRAGDYLLPSNDGKILWRILLYTEGPSSGLDWPRDEDVWGLWRRPVIGSVIDVEDWSQWEFHDGLYKSRGEAIDSALKAQT